MKQAIFEQIAQFVSIVKFDDLPKELISLIKTALIDYTGVCIAGMEQNSVKSVMRYAEFMSSKQEATIFGIDKKTSVEFAAMINSISAHSLDFDDVSWTSIAHPSVVVAPVCFALAQKLNLSGKELILAYGAATEAMHKIAKISMPNVSQNGWHTTSVYGVFGAIVSAAILYKTPPKNIINALGLGSSKASGIRANFGTDTKAYHAGMACYNGLEALSLANFGLGASRLAFEGDEGFLQIYGGINGFDLKLNLTMPWDLLENGLVFKKYPCCSGSHPAADLINELILKYNLKFEDIAHIDVGCSLLAPKELKCDFPNTALEAKFSMRYAIASMLIYKNLGLNEFSDERVQDIRIQSLMRKIDVKVDEEFAKLGFIGTSPVKIHIELNFGKIIKGKRMLAKGNPQNPMSIDEIKDKFYICTKNIKYQNRIFEILSELEKFKNLDEFFKLI